MTDYIVMAGLDLAIHENHPLMPAQGRA